MYKIIRKKGEIFIEEEKEEEEEEAAEADAEDEAESEFFVSRDG